MNIESESPLFKNVAKILQTCYFGYFENVSPPQPKTINKLETFMFIYKPKIKLIPHFLLQVSRFECLRAFWPVTWEPKSCQIQGLHWSIINNMIFNFRLFPGITNETFLKKCKKTPFRVHFAHFWTKQNFPQSSLLPSFLILTI